MDTTDEQVRPAVSAEEWAQGWINRPFVKFEGDSVTVYSFDDVALTQDARHAVAALCLHGQPFGFTWDDVDSLLQVNNDRLFVDRFNPEAVKLWERVDRTIAKLAALLPPREP